jgi:hypothetical protein
MAEGAAGAGPGVGEVAATYLGNLLYALERCALALEDEGKGEEEAGNIEEQGRNEGEDHCVAECPPEDLVPSQIGVVADSKPGGLGEVIPSP